MRATELVEQRYGIRPAPGYRRRFPRGGKGSSLQLFRSTSTITAATGLLEADRGSGTVQPINNATGEDDGDPITISNPGFDSFAENSIGHMNKDTTPPLVVSVFCLEIPPEALPEEE